jgi:hypothetical protein
MQGTNMHVGRTTEGWLRLVAGVVLNVALMSLAAGPGGRWGGYDREAHFSLILIAVAAPALVSEIPLFWRGQPWQAAVALPLLVLPCIALLIAVDTIASH